MNDIRYWLALRQIEGLDWYWLQHDFLPTHTLAQLFAEPEQYPLSPRLHKRLQTTDWAIIDKEAAWVAQDRQYRLTLPDPQYPKWLRSMTDPPPVLYVEGQLDVLLTPQIAIVGTRHPTHAGIQTAKQFAMDLAAIGLSVTSGLAHGIDAAAHQGALAAKGKTLAVMGTGINHRYPKQHVMLAKQIAEEGALLTELPPDAPPLAAHFPARNRIITGLSLGVVVIEAALKSGSLISARLANEQGRLVMAVPGSINNPQTQGCHWLLKQGAILVSCASDIIEELPDYLTQTFKKSPKISPLDLAKAPSDLVQYLGLEPQSVEAIIARSGKSVTTVQTELTLLVLSGHAELVAGGYVIA